MHAFRTRPVLRLLVLLNWHAALLHACPLICVKKATWNRSATRASSQQFHRTATLFLAVNWLKLILLTDKDIAAYLQTGGRRVAG